MCLALTEWKWFAVHSCVKGVQMSKKLSHIFSTEQNSREFYDFVKVCLSETVFMMDIIPERRDFDL